MAVLFFDSSALIRRYTRTEPGARRVRLLCSRRAGHTVIISRLSRVEVASAFARKLREGVIDRRVRNLGWRLFLAHQRDRFHLFMLDEHVYLLAEELVSRYPLRTLDALQLACALRAAAMFVG